VSERACQRRRQKRADLRAVAPVSPDELSGTRRDKRRRAPSSSGGPDTTTGSSRQPRHHQTHPRAETPEPLEPQPTPRPRHRSHHSSSPALPAFLTRRLEQLTPPRLTHLIPAYLICLTPTHLAAAPPHATQASRLGYPGHIYLASRGRGVRRSAADPPSSQAPAQSQDGRMAGRRPVALKGETHRAKQMEGNRRSETGQAAARSPIRRWRHDPDMTASPSVTAQSNDEGNHAWLFEHDGELAGRLEAIEWYATGCREPVLAWVASYLDLTQRRRCSFRAQSRSLRDRR
jgi:hypothetical protein